MVDDYSFNKFCELLNDEAILKTSTAFGVAKQFQTYIADIKSQVLKELMNRTENQDVYLEFLINEIEKQEYVKDAGLNYIERWLKEYDTTIEKVLEHANYKSPIYTVLDRHYNDMEPFSAEKDKAHLVQMDFLNYFCNLYANELIDFLKSKKPKPKKQENMPPPTNNKPFKDQYLMSFCRELSDERAIKETSFMQLYDSGITHYGPYLESEIIENLLLLGNDKKEDYLNYVLDKINKTPFANIPEDYIDKWIKKYDVDLNEFPNFKNKELNETLETYYKGEVYTTHQEQQFLLDIQIDFYCYAAMLEVKKIINYLEEKGMKNIKKEDSHKHSKAYKDLNEYEKIIYLFSKIREINYKLNQEPFFSFSDDERENKLIVYDARKEVYQGQIKALISDLYLFSHKENIYYFDCPFKVYTEHFDKRKEKYFKENIDAEYIDFLKSEVNYFADPKSNRLIKSSQYNEYIEYEDRYRLSLNKKMDFLKQKLKPFNYDIHTIENTLIKDNIGNAIAYGTEIHLVQNQDIQEKPFHAPKPNLEVSSTNIKLKWSGKKAHLGFLIGYLADLGYINAPLKPNGDINYSEFARNVLEVFDCDTTHGSLSKYLNTTSEKSDEVRRNFSNSKLYIPHSKEVN